MPILNSQMFDNYKNSYATGIQEYISRFMSIKDSNKNFEALLHSAGTRVADPI
jgi:hypothetical protein